VARLRLRGWSYPKIAAHLGFADESGARYAFERAAQTLRSEGVEAALQLALSRLDEEYHVALQVLEANHYAWNEKGLIYNGTELIRDHTPVLNALQVMLRIEDQRNKLLGLYAPTKSQVSVFTQDQIDAEIAALEQEIAEREASRPGARDAGESAAAAGAAGT